MSDEKDVAGMNGTALAIRQAQDQHAIAVERVETALYRFAIGLRDAHRRAGGMGVGQPVGAYRILPLRPPDRQPMGEQLRKADLQGGRVGIRGALPEQAGDRKSTSQNSS